MELVLKRPDNKPPFICIKFDTNWQASNFNQILLDQCKKSTFTITFHLLGGKLDILIIGADKRYKYKDLKFSPEKLNRFLQETQHAGIFSLCHIIKITNKDSVVKTIASKFLRVLKIDGIQLNREY